MIRRRRIASTYPLAHPNTSNPFAFTIDSSFLAAPLGRLSPRSHLLTRLVVTLR